MNGHSFLRMLSLSFGPWSQAVTSFERGLRILGELVQRRTPRALCWLAGLF